MVCDKACFLQSNDISIDKPSVLITGGVHGYEKSGVQGAILFLQTQQCSALATASAGVVGGLVTCVPSTLLRLAFLLGRDPRSKRHYDKLSAERERATSFCAAPSAVVLIAL